MFLVPIKFSGKKDYYISFYEEYQPKNIHSLEYVVHDVVGTLIRSQLEMVFDCEDLSSSTKDLEKFIRELKVEFDCVHSNFEAFEYPRLISMLQGLIPSDEFKKYHSSVISLLKVLLFRVSESQFPTEAEKKLCNYTTTFVNQLNPSSVPVKLFSDKPEMPNKYLNVEEAIQKQIDIALDSDY